MTRARVILAAVGAVALAGLAVALARWPAIGHLLVLGEERELRQEDASRPATSEEPTLLIVALDGVDRPLLYGMLRKGELPSMSKLLGGGGGRDGARFEHAYLDDRMLSTLPSSTLAAWATVFTGEPPGAHGVAGNEYFIREARRMAAPAPVSIADPEPVIQTYTKGYANELLGVPTVYQRMREQKPALSIWVSMSQFHGGADRLLLADRTVIANAFKSLVSGAVQEHGPEGVYAQFDKEVVDTVVDALKEGAPPHVLTIYLTGTDHYAHGASEGPDTSRATYLREVVDPLMERLRAALDARGSLRNRFVVLTSDHGHTEVKHDARHALSTDEKDDPPAVLRGAGFRVRPFELDVAADADFDSVIAYGGAMAYVYVADRSTCRVKAPCDWARPPRYTEDVVAVANAFYEAGRIGTHAPSMKGALDLVLVRKPRPFAEKDAPFEVYVGGGKTEPLGEHLARNPHPTYVAIESRLADLAAGRFGERAGDVLLLAHNGDRDRAEERFYFAGLYRSWHGSPSRRDSEVPLIVAHPSRSAPELEVWSKAALGERPRQQDIARIFLRAVGVTDDVRRDR